jgi:hypothetical protein
MSAAGSAGAAGVGTNLESAFGSENDGIDAEVLLMSAADIKARTQLLANNIRVMKSDLHSIEQDAA